MSTKKHRERPVESAAEGIALTPELISEFIGSIREKGYVEGTLERYRRDLQLLYDSLTGEKRIGKGTLALCRRQLLEDGYAARTVNLRISAANSLLGYLGLREYQLIEQVKPKQEPLPELTRTEYLQLLRTARALGKERVYLLIKLFATTDLPVQELSKVTVEAVTEGTVQVISSGVSQTVRIPPTLRRELLDYARRSGCLHGPVFLARGGAPMSRTNVTVSMRQLCEAAHLPPEKGNPRCLRRLYQSTLEEIESNVRLLVQQAQDRMLEMEQAAVGWREGSASVS